MSPNMSFPSPIQPLSIGDVVSAGLRLYRSHLKSYFKLSLRAYLWVLVPIYGWAKFGALAALISRLAFGELVNQPESVETGRRYVNSKLWQFLVASIITGLIGLGVGIIAVFVFFILFFISAQLAGGIQGGNAAILIIILLAIPVAIAFITGVLWLMTHFYIVEVPLAIEDNVDGNSTISRSWELTKGYVWRILAIALVAYLITLPLVFVSRIIGFIIQIILILLLKQTPVEQGPFSSLVNLGIGLLVGAMILPFWQAIKAVIYYDLRSRQEGLGLKLRNHSI